MGDDADTWRAGEKLATLEETEEAHNRSTDENMKPMRNQNGIIFMKDHLSNNYALVMLLGAALGSGFLSIPYAFVKFQWETIGLLLLNFAAGLVSCYFLVQVCAITQLESFQELLYMFGGGRASILFLTCMQVGVYSLMPIIFLCKPHSFQDYR